MLWIDYVYAVAIAICALCSFRVSRWRIGIADRTAFVLTCSAAAAALLTWFTHDFERWIFAWAAIDVGVYVALIRPGMTRREVMILMLMIPGWVFYVMDPAWRGLGTTVVVIVQTMLAIPLAQIRGRIGHIPPLPDVIGEIFKKVAP